MYDRKEMFKAVCSDCGDNCEVPFKPTGSKPVLCSSCFGQQGGGRSDGRENRSGGRGNRFSGRDNRRDSRSGDRQMHQVVCDKCGDNCEVPFRPTAGKPIYCNDCFGKTTDRGERRGGDRRSGGRGRDNFREKSGGGDNDKITKELSSMNSKLDRLITLLDPSAKKLAPKKEKPELVAPLDLNLDVEPKTKDKMKTAKKPAIKKAIKTKVTKKVAKKPIKKTSKKKK